MDNKLCREVMTRRHSSYKQAGKMSVLLPLLRHHLYSAPCSTVAIYGSLFFHSEQTGQCCHMDKHHALTAVTVQTS